MAIAGGSHRGRCTQTGCMTLVGVFGVWERKGDAAGMEVIAHLQERAMLKPQPQQASCSIVGAPSEHHPIGCSPTASHGSPRAYPREPNAHRLARTLHLTADLKLWAARLLAAAKANCLTHSGRAAKHARITAVFAIVPANACPPAPCCEPNTHQLPLQLLQKRPV